MPRESLAAPAAGVRKPARQKVAMFACDNCRTKRVNSIYQIGYYARPGANDIS